MTRKRLSITNIRKSTWAIFATIAFISLATYALRKWLSSGDWAGLGQWFGGLGALIAAWVALRIASDERRREGRRDAERLRVQAYYIVGGVVASDGSRGVQVFVRNTGPEPVVNVDIVALHVDGRSDNLIVECAPTAARRHVLLPGEEWQTWVKPTKEDLTSDLLLKVMDVGPVPEFTFDDLAETRWHRIGDSAPQT
ncbi:hypothetical protein ACGFMK_20350 [Amycolatopsis sp. NPDC049252]|uniref:hypothetical protein n=1 Tax=Amycolatopsis sp. NPDC049252 TaxID=3363933 RepID=UPI00371B07EC